MTAGPGRTYRYLKVPVLYPFGHGLSYTTFTYSNLTVESSGPGEYQVALHVSNTGAPSPLLLSFQCFVLCVVCVGTWCGGQLTPLIC